jgi:iron(III) transport system permease protein
VLLSQVPQEFEIVAALSVALLLVAVALLSLQKRVLGRKGFATITARGMRRSRIELGRWRYPALNSVFLSSLWRFFFPTLF